MSRERSLGNDRGFSEAILPNGLRCICVRDPKMENLAVQLDINCGFFQDPVDLSGLADISLNTVFRGSENYPGIDDFRNFARNNEIEFHAHAYLAKSRIAAAVPHHALEEYLDRLTDLMSKPILSAKGLEIAESKHGQAYYADLNNNYYREVHLLRYLHYRVSHQTSLLFKRKDLITRIREFVNFYYCPSKMTVYIMGDALIVDMKALSHKYFQRLSQKIHPKPLSLGLVGCDLNFTDSLRIPGQAVLAKMFTKSKEKRLTLSFRLPPGAKISSIFYIAYLFHTSQAHSLQHKLKFDGLIDQLDVQYRDPTSASQTLNVHLSMTNKGSQSVSIIVGFVMGYIEIIRRMQPNCHLFNQAHIFFKSVRVMDSCFTILNRFASESALGSNLDDPSLAEVPRLFDANSINDITHSLKLNNCVIVATSHDYSDTKVHVETDFFLQYSTASFFTRALFDGLSQPQLDPFVASCKCNSLATSGVELISKNPIVYQRSSSGEFHSVLNVALRSPDFAKFSPPAQRLYASLIAYKFFLVASEYIGKLSIKVVDGDSLDVSVRCLPGSLPHIVRWLVENLSEPLGAEFNEKLNDLKHEEKNLVDMWLSGDQQVEFNPRCEEILQGCMDINQQLRELDEIQSINDLPSRVKGNIVLLFSGNVVKDTSLTVAALTDRLRDYAAVTVRRNIPATEYKASGQIKFEDYRNESLTNSQFNRDVKRTVLEKQGPNSSILKLFNIGYFSHEKWAALLVLVDICNDHIFPDVRQDHMHISELQAKTYQKEGRVWFELKIVGPCSEEHLMEVMCTCIYNDMRIDLWILDESLVKSSRQKVLQNLSATKINSSDHLCLWHSLRSNPEDLNHLKVMQVLLSRMSLVAVRSLYLTFLLKGMHFGTQTSIVRSLDKTTRENDLMRRIKEWGFVGIYETPKSNPRLQERILLGRGDHPIFANCDLYTRNEIKLGHAIAQVNYFENLLSQFT